MSADPKRTRAARVRALHRARPQSRLVRATAAGFVGLTGLAFASGEVSFASVLDPRRQENVRRFLREDLLPYPLREEGFSLAGLGRWAGELWQERGADALVSTLAIAVLAVVLAGLAGALLAPLGARSLMRPDPFGRGAAGGRAGSAGRWRFVVGATRVLGVGLRAIPEYVWAFLLLAMLGVSAWPLVLALALHNAGILSRLGADTIENLDPGPLRALHGLGASRSRLAVAAVLPAGLSRYLLYFFYRYETCVREATVLGMLGVVSLGYWIEDARARLFYDDMFFFVVLGGLLVLLGDLTSTLSRAWLRRAR